MAGELPSELLTLRFELDGGTQDVPLDPRQAQPGEVTRVTVLTPEPLDRRLVSVILLRRSALAAPDDFIASMKDAIRSKNQEWMTSHLEELIAAGLQSKITLHGTSIGGLPATSTVTWDGDGQAYVVETRAVTSASVGSSTSESRTEEVPLPIARLSPRMRGFVLDLKLTQGDRTVLERSIQLEDKRGMQTFVLAY